MKYTKARRPKLILWRRNKEACEAKLVAYLVASNVAVCGPGLSAFLQFAFRTLAVEVQLVGMEYHILTTLSVVSLASVPTGTRRHLNVNTGFTRFFLKVEGTPIVIPPFS